MLGNMRSKEGSRWWCPIQFVSHRSHRFICR